MTNYNFKIWKRRCIINSISEIESNLKHRKEAATLKITTLMDNLPSENKALVNEHGLSVLIERGSKRFLFDCGQGAHTWANARRLGLNVKRIDAVILSHSHYDHAAGFCDLIEQGGGGSVLWTGPRFFEPKFAFDGLKYTDLSCGFDEDYLMRNGVSHCECTDVVELDAGAWLVGNFPRRHSFETIPERFVRQTEKGMTRDDFGDEICLALDTKDGLVVQVGCSHPGILNMIETVHERLNRPVYAVFGGTHLVEADEARVKETVERLRAMGLKILGLSHCSGQKAESCIHSDETVRSCHMAVGDCVWFNE